jgi:hypothetical protein
MVKNYIIEIGVDSNAAPRPDGTYPTFLNLLLVKHGTSFPPAPPVSSGDLTPASFALLNNLDQFCVRVADYSTANTSPLHLEMIEARFLKVADFTSLSWVTESKPICAGRRDLKPLNPHDGSTLPPPQLKNLWGIYTLDGSGEQVMTFNNPGRAILMISAVFIDSTSEDVKTYKRYGHDPEIIVGPGG